MNFEEFLEIINDEKFNRNIYDMLIKDYGFKLISKYFTQLLNSNDLSEDYYDKCKYYLEDDLVTNIDYNFSDSKNIDSLKQYLNEIGQYPLLSQEEERKLLIKLDKLKKSSNELKEKYNIEKLINDYDVDFDNLIDIKDNNIMILKKYLNIEKEYITISNILIESNLRLVVSVAKHYINTNIDILDLIQEGNIGIKNAIDKFDIEKGNKFSTYAIWWIRQHIVREIHTNSRSIKLPVHKHELFYKVKRAINLYEKEYNRTPSNEELIKFIKNKVNDGTLNYSKRYDNLTSQVLEDLKKITQNVASLDVKVGEDDDSTLGDFIVNEDQESVENIVAKKMLKESIKIILEQLTPREKFVLILRTGMSLNKYMSYEEFISCFNALNFDEIYYKKLYTKMCTKQKQYTLEEIAKNYGLTHERIRQIEAKALRKIRNNKKIKVLKPDLLDLYN